MYRPTFNYPDINGNMVSSESLIGKVIYIDVWATWCGPCKKSFPALQDAVNEYKDNENVRFLFINTWERVENKKENGKQSNFGSR